MEKPSLDQGSWGGGPETQGAGLRLGGNQVQNDLRCAELKPTASKGDELPGPRGKQARRLGERLPSPRTRDPRDGPMKFSGSSGVGHAQHHGCNTQMPQQRAALGCHAVWNGGPCKTWYPRRPGGPAHQAPPPPAASRPLARPTGPTLHPCNRPLSPLPRPLLPPRAPDPCAPQGPRSPGHPQGSAPRLPSPSASSFSH